MTVGLATTRQLVDWREADRVRPSRRHAQQSSPPNARPSTKQEWRKLSPHSNARERGSGSPDLLRISLLPTAKAGLFGRLLNSRRSSLPRKTNELRSRLRSWARVGGSGKTVTQSPDQP